MAKRQDQRSTLRNSRTVGRNGRRATANGGTAAPVRQEPAAGTAAPKAVESPRPATPARNGRPTIAIEPPRADLMPLSGLSNMPPTVPFGSAVRLPTAPAPRSAPVRSREAATRLFGDYSYVKRDLRRIALLTVSALILLVVVSFVLPHWLT